MTYQISLDKLAKIITWLVSIFFALIVLANLSIIKEAGPVGPTLISTLLLLTYFLAFSFRPINYHISEDTLTIHRLLKDVNINRAHIKSVTLLTEANKKWPVRIFAVGGLFGYFGKFASHNLGTTTWYATRKDKRVLIQTVQNKKIVLTPDEPENFIAHLNRG